MSGFPVLDTLECGGASRCAAEAVEDAEDFWKNGGIYGNP